MMTRARLFNVIAFGAFCTLGAACVQSSVGSLNPEDPNVSSGDQGSSGDGSTGSGATTGSGAGGMTSSGATSSSHAASSGASTGSGMVAMWEASLDTSQVDADLDASASIVVSIDPKGFKGNVSISVSGLAQDVDAQLDKATLALDGSTVAKAKLSLTTHSDTVTGDQDFKITASSAAESSDLPAKMTVNPTITIHIPKGVNQMSGSNSFGPNPLVISSQGIDQNHPVSVKFMNDDDTDHQVHAENPEFKHDPNPIPAHTMDPYVRTPYSQATFNYYLHDQGGPQNTGAVKIQ